MYLTLTLCKQTSPISYDLERSKWAGWILWERFRVSVLFLQRNRFNLPQDCGQQGGLYGDTNSKGYFSLFYVEAGSFSIKKCISSERAGCHIQSLQPDRTGGLIKHIVLWVTDNEYPYILFCRPPCYGSRTTQVPGPQVDNRCCKGT